MDKTQFSSLSLEDLALVPLEEDAAPQAQAPAVQAQASKIDTRKKRERRSGVDRRVTIRFEEDRRSGVDRRAQNQAWGHGHDL
ncbi:hypothetical protein EA796_17710 [Pseudomonas sp. AOB-7]|uniref:hypothetical protein n=1 Tax=unclassified Pseudomonas TaxID=196821 RepID=UPI000396C5CF|nr:MULTISPECIES: hypothetical protein [unclassified Pseudomonas]ERI51408.1 hypothetical protein N878_22735 [Pseudomonas sp. EGD-AK9]RMH83012.1 hypothetical protein EA796_17710 [Pseudomonas sp. AOB-7]